MSVPLQMIPSIYIKHVNAEITTEMVTNILEKTYNLGKIDKIYSRPKISEKDGHEYYSCDIHFKSWTNDPNAIEMMSVFKNRKETRLNYSGNKFWHIRLFQNRYDINSNYQYNEKDVCGSLSPVGIPEESLEKEDNMKEKFKRSTPVMLIIYVIYHKTYDNINIFTTDKNKIQEIIINQSKKWKNSKEDWKYRTIIENDEFCADMKMIMIN